MSKFANIPTSRPVKRWSSLEGMRQHFCWGRPQKNDKNFWPCFRCHGAGKIADPRQYDPIEGSKLADLISCPECANGNIGPAKYDEAYQVMLKEYQRQNKLWVDFIDKARDILQKLTWEEGEILEFYFKNMERGKK